MNSTKASAPRKTGGLIGKNLIIFLVLLVVCALSIWAWFTSKTDATANGIRLTTKSDGVEVSWDGKDWYKDLTALNASAVTDEIGPAKNVDNPKSLNLITGNGLKFFEPVTNRRTGTVLMNGNAWQGREITTSNNEGRFIDVDLYFRGTSARDVFLAADSLVAPKNINGNYSDFGAFSKDYIAAASRVAFLDAKKENVSFIWAPNADVELVYNDAGYTRITNKITEDVTTGGPVTIDGGVVNDNKTYYFWSLWDDSVVTTSPQDLNKFEARKFTYDSERRYFVTTVTMYIPTYGNDNPSIPIFVNESATKPSPSSVNQYNNYINGYNSSQTLRADLGQYLVVTNTAYNVGDAAFSNTMKVVSGGIDAGSKITFELGYDPVNKLLVVLNYQVAGGASFDLASEDTSVTTTVTYYNLDNNTNSVLVSPSAGVAVSSDTHYMKSVRFSDSATKLNVTNMSVSSKERFIAEKTGDKHEATYKFKNASTNEYLSIANGEISLNSTGSAFTLEIVDAFNSPVLKSGDYYLVFEGSSVKAVTAEKLDVNKAVTVYTGSTHSVVYSSNAQPYQYYDSQEKALKTLSESTTPKLYASTKNWSTTNLITNAATTKIDTKIATLTKASDDDEYYTAHIVMRIWVEGTDREAKTPLADGLFDVSLHFISQ